MATVKERSLLLETRPGFLDKPFIFCFLGLSVLLAGCANSSDNEERYIQPSIFSQMQAVDRQIARKTEALNDSPSHREQLRQELKDLYQQRDTLHREWLKPDVW
ncbi:MAG: hypothetical protein U1F76_27350 [Candidatus Competibacteraceae bacterium]